MAKCACEIIGKRTRVETPLIHAYVYLSERTRTNTTPNPNAQCLIRNLLMAVDASAAELGTQPANIIPLNHLCEACGYILTGYLEPDIVSSGNFTNNDTDHWGSGWSKDN